MQLKTIAFRFSSTFHSKFVTPKEQRPQIQKHVCYPEVKPLTKNSTDMQVILLSLSGAFQVIPLSPNFRHLKTSCLAFFVKDVRR